jgi:plasmid stabilization system protein ParE
MKVEYSRRAIADLHKMADDSSAYGRAAAEGLETRLRQVIAHVAEHPLAAPAVENRPGVHVLPLVRYPYRVFYRVLRDRVLILHIRHTSRRLWKGR